MPGLKGSAYKIILYSSNPVGVVLEIWEENTTFEAFTVMQGPMLRLGSIPNQSPSLLLQILDDTKQKRPMPAEVTERILIPEGSELAVGIFIPEGITEETALVALKERWGPATEIVRVDKEKLERYFKLQYPILLTRNSQDDHVYWFAEIPDLPGCAADGPTPSDAIDAIREAKHLWLWAQIRGGYEIPDPTEHPYQLSTKSR